MRKLLKDPFFHFIGIGIALFLVYGFVSDTDNSRDVIVFDSNDLASLSSKWEMQWNRTATQEELSSLVLQNIKQEVFYQEALKMNLDHNDEIIKRRLSQKMEFLSNDLATLSQPSDQELEDYLASKTENYLLPFEYDLYQIVFTNDKHKDSLNALEDALKRSSQLSLDEMRELGDNLPFPFYYANTTAEELASQLGSAFSDSIVELGLNSWHGPVSSGYGSHLVYITRRNQPKLPELKSIKDLVLRDFQYDKQKELNEMIFQSLKDKYSIELDFDESEEASDFKSLIEKKLSN